ncbi:hypothetical protein H2248_003951 [Termitomyces sp. 'cryptogamus']|nr:hypothetical protein H2248_003951 [Termitomyces sp. 'cryptogamus']
MSSIFGKKQCLIFAYSVFGLGSLWCGISQNLQQLVGGRALAGIGGGGISTIIMSDIVPLRSRGTWQGIINVIFAVGAGIGAPLGGYLADTIGWRWIFLIQVPATFVAIASVSIALHIPTLQQSNLKAKLKRVDFAGSTALILCIFSLLVALDRGGNSSWSDTLTIYSLGAFACMFIIFMATEEWFAVEPFAPRLVVWGPSLIASYFVNFFSVAAGTTMVFHISLYYQAIRELKASEAGILLIPSILSGVAGSLAAGLLMQANGKYYSLTVIAYAMTVAGAVMTLSMAGTMIQSDWGVSLGLAVYGLGNGIGITTSLVSLIVNAGPENQAIATATSYLYRSLGAVVGVSIGNTLFQNGLRWDLTRKLTGTDVEEMIVQIRESLAYLGSLDPAIIAIIRSSYAHNVQLTLVLSAGLTICAFFCSFFIKEKMLGSQHEMK